MAAIIPAKSAISPHVTALRVLWCLRFQNILLKYRRWCPMHRERHNWHVRQMNRVQTVSWCRSSGHWHRCRSVTSLRPLAVLPQSRCPVRKILRLPQCRRPVYPWHPKCGKQRFQREKPLDRGWSGPQWWIPLWLLRQRSRTHWFFPDTCYNEQ